jgi:hypothetical protein
VVSPLWRVTFLSSAKKAAPDSLPCGFPSIVTALLLLIAALNYSASIAGRFDYELHPCSSPFEPAKLFKFVPDKFIASLLNKTQSAAHGRLPLCLQCSANLKGRVNQKTRIGPMPLFIQPIAMVLLS